MLFRSLNWSRIGIAVGVKPGQIGIVLRRLLIIIELIILDAKIIIYVIVEIGFGRLRLLLLGQLLLRQCLGFEQRQIRLSELLCAAFNLLAQTILCEIAAANTLRVSLQVLKDAVHIPTAANIVSHDGVKHVRSIFARRRTFARDLLNDLDWVFAPAAVEAVALARCGLFC